MREGGLVYMLACASVRLVELFSDTSCPANMTDVAVLIFRAAFCGVAAARLGAGDSSRPCS